MDDLIAFLTARLDEDEAAANAVYGIWRADKDGNIVDDSYAAHLAIGPHGKGIDSATRAHILRYDPARALREVEAKRQLMEEISSRSSQGVAEIYLAVLAAVYSGHPDYRPEWKP